MEDSKTQRKIIDLGKKIIKELELDPGVDTLSKWMAHYVAEKIKLANELTGNKKSIAEKECFEIILKLWNNRWSVPPFKNHLEGFTPLLETLDRLNPNKEAPFFYPAKVQFALEKDNNNEKSDEIEKCFDTIQKVDKLARSIISNQLSQIASAIELSKEGSEIIRNAADIIDYPDTRIIRISFGEDFEDKNKKIESLQIKTLKDKINELKEFSTLCDSLLNKYNEQLLETEKLAKISSQIKPPKTDT